tara:strand:+ start:4263 stop:4811 length:549 start_codon:yes stop_codon:yes gene_type:complete
MMNTTLKTKIHEAIRALIIERTEEEAAPETPPDDPKPEDKKTESEGASKIITKGAFGGGRFSEMFRSQQTRAERDPRGLMDDLGVKSGSGADDLSKAESIISQAIGSNELMERAFSEPATSKIDGLEAVSFSPASSDLSSRDATKYIYLTLLAAENAGMLQLKEGIKFLPRQKVSIPTIVSL